MDGYPGKILSIIKVQNHGFSPKNAGKRNYRKEKGIIERKQEL